MYLWASLDHKIKTEEENKMLKGNKFAILATDKQEAKKYFARPV